VELTASGLADGKRDFENEKSFLLSVYKGMFTESKILEVLRASASFKDADD
jgi:hypothetical protein